MRIAVDFDGTIVEHKYPLIGPEVPGAFDCLKGWQKAGHSIVLWTMRSDDPPKGRRVLSDAVEFCKSKGLEFESVNEGKGDRGWTSSPKVYAHIYIDDAAIGCPLRDSITTDRPCVDWSVVGPMVNKKLGV